jgi:hypothetical protein
VGNKREVDRDDMPEADSSADLEVNPISEIGVYVSCVLWCGVTWHSKDGGMDDRSFGIKDGFISSCYYVLRINKWRCSVRGLSLEDFQRNLVDADTA